MNQEAASKQEIIKAVSHPLDLTPS